jgi:HNH endonuclease
MTRIGVRLRRAVIRRAADRCEYCRIAQAGQEATFHIDHVIPEVDGGQTKLENLALACVSCSLRKAARTFIADPKTGKLVPFFSPRRDQWQRHFRWDGVIVVGLTPIGRATVAALDLNRPRILAIREEELCVGRHPPPAE